jgi:hypothetical protein
LRRHCCGENFEYRRDESLKKLFDDADEIDEDLLEGSRGRLYRFPQPHPDLRHVLEQAQSPLRNRRGYEVTVHMLGLQCVAPPLRHLACWGQHCDPKELVVSISDGIF